jgi:renalase
VADVLVVGAGIAGVLAARSLGEAGHRVAVVDKGYTPGGRMATRHLDGATFDHGAQFLTTKHDDFASLVDRLVEAGVVTPWFTGSPDPGTDDDGHVRLRGSAGMRGVVEHLAAGLDLRTQTRLTALRPAREGWVAETEDDPALRADAVVATAPVPQVLALLTAGGATLPPEADAALRGVSYARCIAVLAVPDAPPALPHRGALRLGSEPIEWLADGVAKGISDRPAVTIHAGPRTSLERWDAPPDEVGTALCAAAAEHLGTACRPVRVHRWRYARPTSEPVPGGIVAVDVPAPLVVAGDGLAGGRVEGAARSGWAAAAALSGRLEPPGG